MKKITQKPLMLAYLIFLSLSVVFYIVCKATGWSFPAWNNIIVAATAASYFFALSSSDKALAKVYDSTAARFDEYNKLLTAERKELQASGIEPEELDFLTERIKSNADTIDKYNKKSEKNAKSAFVLDVIGYLVFFCTVSFDWLYVMLSYAQDVLTITAFIMILFVEYAEDAQTARVNDVFDTIIKEHKELFINKRTIER